MAFRLATRPFARSGGGGSSGLLFGELEADVRTRADPHQAQQLVAEVGHRSVGALAGAFDDSGGGCAMSPWPPAASTADPAAGRIRSERTADSSRAK
jgi:hypothetical protein